MKLLVYYYFDMPWCDDLSVKCVAKEPDSSNFHCCKTLAEMVSVIEKVRWGMTSEEIAKDFKSVPRSSGSTWRRWQDTDDELKPIREWYYGGEK